VENLDAEGRAKFDNDLFTPPEFRSLLRRINETGAAS
jgi:hypothetical protein